MVNDGRGLGRRIEFDEESRNYPIRATITAVTPRSYTWRCLTYLNQGSEGACVGYSISHEINARPLERRITTFLARLLYKEAQKIDEWQGEAYEGTSILAGMKVSKDLGFFDEYRWAFGIDDLVLALGYKGPTICGVPWFDGMFDPDANGVLHPTGAIAGGHAILATGVNVTTKMIRLHNSWGQAWGVNGDAYISFADMAILLQQQGEACVPVVRA